MGKELMFDSGDLDLGERGEWDAATNGTDTGMRLHEGETWPVVVDILHPDSDHKCSAWRFDDAGKPIARLRRIGWLDQRGRVWLKIPSTAKAASLGCGSFTPLLIDPGERT
jgi:hypothetical protein